jgi:hypothetical protein
METKYYRSSSVVIGLMLIVLGLAFFAATQGAFGLDWGNIWPLFPIVVGIGLLVAAFVADNANSRAGLVVPGTIALLLGSFFLATTTGILSWSDQGTLWPIYPLIVGVSLLAAYAVSGFRQPGYLIPGLIVSMVGLVFLGVVLTGTAYDYIGKIWPIFVIIAGVLILVLPRSRRTV